MNKLTKDFSSSYRTELKSSLLTTVNKCRRLLNKPPTILREEELKVTTLESLELELIHLLRIIADPETVIDPNPPKRIIHDLSGIWQNPFSKLYYVDNYWSASGFKQKREAILARNRVKKKMEFRQQFV